MKSKLTSKQTAFAEYYLQCGNASEAARNAGYSRKYTNTNASKLLQNTTILKYIEEHLSAASAERIASADEVLEYFTRVMRGEEKDAFGLDLSIADRTRAAEALAKRYGLFTDKIDMKLTGPTIIEGGNEIED